MPPRLPLLLMSALAACPSKTGFPDTDPAVDSVGHSGHSGQETSARPDTDPGGETGPVGETSDTFDTASTHTCDPVVAAGAPVEVATCQPVPEVTWDMVVEWETDFSVPAENDGVVVGVLPLDGDMPRVVTGEGESGAFFEPIVRSGTNGEVVFSIGRSYYGAASVGVVGRIGIGQDPYLAAADADGLILAISLATGEAVYSPEGDMDGTYVSMNDLDRDGTAEFINAAMTLWMDRTVQHHSGLGSGVPLVADVDEDGRLEVVNRAGIWDPLTAEGMPWPLARTDGIWGDQFVVVEVGGQVHFGVTNSRTFMLVDLEGYPVWSFATSAADGDEIGEHALPAAGDADGDGDPEFCVPTMDAVVLLSAEGEVERSWAPSTDNAGGCSMADLDADGAMEVIALGEGGLHVYSGVTGETLASDPDVYVNRYRQSPIVADIDGDESAEILIWKDYGEERGMRAYGPARGRWARTRRVWHRSVYDITSISDEGVILSWPFPSWEAYNAYNAQPAHDGDHPDLSPSATGACADACVDGVPQGSVHVSVQVSNAGSTDAPAGATIRLFTWDPEAADPVLQEVASTVMAELVPSLWSAPGLVLDVPAEQWTGYQVLQVDGAHDDECDRVNDRVELRLDPCAE